MWKLLKMWKSSKATKRDIKEINYDAIKDNDYIIIDVRSKNEYLEGHIDGAINIPLSVIKDEIYKIPKDKKVLLYCQSGSRSKRALKILEDLEYCEVYNLKGGLENI